MICNLDKEIINMYYNDYKFFFDKPNVQGIGYGYKRIKGITTHEPSIHVFVSKKVPSHLLNSNGVLPSLYKGIKTDVIETGPFTASGSSIHPENYRNNNPNNPPFTGKKRPIQPSFCMSVIDPTVAHTGTFGYIVTDNEQVSKAYCLLSNNPTFANYNDAPIGTKIIQPSRGFGGPDPNNVVAKLLRFVTIRFAQNTPNSLDDFNTIDAAVASLFSVKEVDLINPIIPFIGFVEGIISPELFQSYQWTGCLSGHQQGTIQSISCLVQIQYDFRGLAFFKDIALGEGALSHLEDRGALVCDMDKKAMGLLFGISTPYSYNAICNIQDILSMLKVSLLIL